MVNYMSQNTYTGNLVYVHSSHTSDPSLTLSNMMSALDSLPGTEWGKFGWAVDMPESMLDKIRSQFTSDGERKEEVFRVYLTEHPCPTWEQVSYALYLLGNNNQQYHNVLDRLQSMFPTGECVFLSLLTFSLAPHLPLNFYYMHMYMYV